MVCLYERLRPTFNPFHLRRSTVNIRKQTSLSCALTAALLLLTVGGFKPTQAQSSTERDRARAMLQTMKEDIKKYYYDPNFHGMDLEARFGAAEEKIKTATSLGQLFGIIAQAMVDLNDSHTRFVPPPRTTSTEYGWQMEMIGDRCFIVTVKPGSDAEKKGLKEGDEIISVNGVGPNRNTLWKMLYFYYTLAPRSSLRVTAQSPNSEPREIDINARIKQGQKTVDMTDYDEYVKSVRQSQSESRLYAHRYYDNFEDVFIWKMPEFDLAENKVDEMMSKARNRKALILDLRGNPGGDEITLLRLISHFFDKDLTIGELQRRKEKKPLISKKRSDKPFSGQLIVLVDSQSASSAEIFARVMQLEKRATVIGDQTAGAVMRSRLYGHQLGVDIVVPYGASITDANLVMTDGKSLEGAGVAPDDLRLPTPEDLASRRDPILAHAASLVGLRLDPTKAGALFPVLWSKD
jgi:C-terminal processing protease CtpA/Prc